jgi:hypothetical protein
MTREHPQWDEFMVRLEESPLGKTTTQCGSTRRRAQRQ